MKHMFFAIVAIVILSGCTQINPLEKEEENNVNQSKIEHSMEDMPCHQMPDGSWMGDCDQDNFLLTSSDINDLPIAESTTIVNLDDGDTYTISANIVQKNLAGASIKMYAYNGQIPGVALRVKQGTTATIVFENNIDQDTTVHWHGLRHDIKHDGVPGVSQEPVKPGDTHTYQLYFPDDGIYWYHPHIREDVQQDLGLAGNMLVVPEVPYNPVNREELLVLDDILLSDDGSVVPFGEMYANFALMGRFGNTMLVNGQTDFTLEAKRREVIRLYLTNVANARPFNFSIAGAKMKLVGGDLGQYGTETFVDSVVIAPAERYFVDVFFEKSGQFDIMHVNPHESYKLGSVVVSDEATLEDFSSSFYDDLENIFVTNDIASFEEYFAMEPTYVLDLDVSMSGMMANMPCHVMGGIIMGRCSTEERAELRESLEEEHGSGGIEWEDEMSMRMSAQEVEWIIRDQVSQQQNMELTLTANVGDVIKIRLVNKENSIHPMQHPIHLHGQRFVVTHIDGVAVDNKVWKDTVLVPIGSTVDILVDVTNPGEWMMHCHIAEHLEAGMMVTFVAYE